MSKLKKCIFILHLLRTHREMTQKEIGAELEKEFYGDSPLVERTFSRYKEFIEENFPCRIVFDKSRKTYSLYNRSSTYAEDEQLFNYLFSMYNVEASAELLLKHSSKIHNAEIITGTDRLHTVLRAIDAKRGIECDYCSFNNGTIKRRTLIPMFLSTWEGRWYLVAEVTTHPGSPVVYCLERMSNIILSDETMVPSVDVSIKDYFRDSYGIQHASEEDKPLDIIIRATGPEVEYLRARPIHPSQKELKEYNGFSIIQSDKADSSGDSPFGGRGAVFSLHLTPCYNFYQQLLWHREAIEILEPQEVKDEIKRIVNNIIDKY